MGRLALGMALVALGLVAVGCGPVGGGAPDLRSPPPAVLVGKVIRRDPQVERAIAESRREPLARGRADRRLVAWKAARCLQVIEGGRVVRTFPLALGGSPAGPKQREGDGRTPEGRYVLIPQHRSARYGPCFYVCYPNEIDAERGVSERVIASAARARILAELKRGARPSHGTGLGGSILLRGTKRRQNAYLTITDWSDGSLVVENADLDVLLGAYGLQDRPVLEILP